MVQARENLRRHGVVVGALLTALTALFLTGIGQLPANADVSAVSGSAYGYFADVNLLGDAGPAGPAPTVTLPPTGGNETASLPNASVGVGIATFIETGQIDVSTEGTTGPTGSVTSSADIAFLPPQEEQPDPFNADAASSTCTASESGVSGSTTVTNGVVEIAYDDAGVPTETVDVATNPAPNTEITGSLTHVGDNFRVVLNEQIVSGNSITVNAVHIFMLGPIAQGEVILGQSVCGVTTTPGSTTTTAGGGSTTTTAGGGGSTTTTAGGGGSTTTTAGGGGSTTTTVATPGGPIDLDAEVLGNGTAVRITGTVDCDEGNRFRVMVDVTQDSVEGSKTIIGDCTGEPTNFRAKVFPSSGEFAAGTASVDATVDIWNPDTRTIDDTFSTSEDVTVDVPGGFMGEVVDAVMAMEPPA